MDGAKQMSTIEPACSQTTLVYRSIAGELSSEESDALAIHLDGCDRCRRTKAEVERAQGDLELARPVDRAFREAQRPRAQRRPRWALRTAGLIATATAAGFAAFLLAAPPRQEDLRGKGGLDAELIVHRDGKPIDEPAAYCPLDRLQPVLRSPEAGFVYVFWGQEGEIHPMSTGAPEVRVEAGERLVYPHSFQLDREQRPERLIIAVSERPSEEVLAELRRAKDLDRLRIERARIASWPIDKRCEDVR